MSKSGVYEQNNYIYRQPSNLNCGINT